jgi:urease accessory protein
VSDLTSVEKRSSWPALLLLTDGRFPAGGHAHSGGLEAAAALEGVRDTATLAAFLRGRAATTGAVSAAFAAAACAAAATAFNAAVLDELDRELEARIPSPALRTVSRRLGRQLLRAGRAIWPHSLLEEFAAAIPGGPHHSVTLGVVAAAAGLDPRAAALAAVYDTVTGPATAAVRLLGLDPFGVHAALAGLGPELDVIADAGASHAHRAPSDLPAWSAPLLDMLAERHATWEVRLFAS